MDSLGAEPPGYGSARAQSLTVDLKAMSTLDPAVSAMYDASQNEAKSSADTGPSRQRQRRLRANGTLRAARGSG
jgi:RNA polymerase sigma-70 factor (ECF subfamily)